MDNIQQIIEYKCPCCNAGLTFRQGTRQLQCEYCDNTFDLETVQAYHDSESTQQVEEVTWNEAAQQTWTEQEAESIHTFQCPSCGGQIITDAVTAASFCPYCDNPTIMPSRLSGSIRPDALIPFQTSKEDARAAFLRLCKGKSLLPRGFTDETRLERIAGVYVPFWLYDCDGSFDGSFQATRVHHWSDRKYHYTKTDHYLLERSADASFCGIPMDGSSKADDTFMESIEPFNYEQLTDFDMAYLTGFLADKYDVPSEQGEERIRQRVDNTFQEKLRISMSSYTTTLPAGKQLHVRNSTARYVLLPVWMLNTNYRGKRYTFMMNGQTGKMTGTLPICPKRTAGWFAAVCGGVTLLSVVLRMAAPLTAAIMQAF